MASTYITRTIGSGSAGKIFTISFWLKISSTSANHTIVGLSSDNNSTKYVEAALKSNHKLDIQFRNGTSGDNGTYLRRRTNRVFRDVNAWHHIVIRVDSTQGSASDRFRLYINGVQETSLDVDSTPDMPQNYVTDFNNNGSTFRIGRGAGSSSYYLDGSLSHFHFADGQSLAPTVFGETDSTTGEWKIIASPTFTVGTEGFTILKDGITITDQSSNSNDFTLGGGTLTKTEDCPSNVFCTINPLSNKIAFSLANGNTTLNDNGSDDNDNGIAGTMGVNSGKYYWEMKKGSGSGGVHAIITDDVDIRLGNRATSSPDSQLWGFQSNGTGAALVSYIAGTFDSSGNALQGWGANDIVGFALDMDNGKLYVSINGTFKGLDNNTSDPANATNPAITGIPTGGKFIMPYFEKRSADSPETMCNFGNGYFGTTAVSSNSGSGYSAAGNLGVFQYQPPTGYTALCTKGLNE